ncbi:MAG: hypothetical protein ACRES7_06665 [Gammaproteobacteria bacterium]
MTSNVTSIGKKLKSKQFADSYPRIERDDPTLHEVPSSDRETLKYISPPPKGYSYSTATSAPREGYVKAEDIDLGEVLPKYNQLLIYRIFRLLYGKPDILSAYASKSAKTVHPVDWGYAFAIQDGLVGELRSRYMSRVYLSFWLPEIPASAIDRKIPGEAMAKCFSGLMELVDKNLHLWDHEAAIRGSTNIARINVPAEKYKGGELLLEKASEFDRQPPRNIIGPTAIPPLGSVGYLYLSASIMFFISLESFVNLLYQLLLKEDFKGGTYGRLTERSDLDLRIVAMHIFCRGFKEQPVKPGSELWTRMNHLKNFRNDIVHGNITEEHKIFSFEEDSLLFFYSPPSDFRGGKSKVPQNLTRFQGRINVTTANTIRGIVDDVRDAIVTAMDRETQAWANSWMWQPFLNSEETSL